MTIVKAPDSESLKNLLRDCEPEEISLKAILSLRDQVSRYLFLSDTPGPVDLCLVLGSPTPSNVDPAIFLYKSGYTQNIIVTGYGPTTVGTADCFVPEYEKLRQRALDAGVPADVILVEKFATNTLENFVNSSKIIESHFNWSRLTGIAIAGKPLHMRRALMTARKNWPTQIKLSMLPTKTTTDLQAGTWWKSESGQRRVLTELRAISKYARKGDIQGV